MISTYEIKDIVSKIAASYQPEKIILFGSYAQKNATEDSDLDLFIIKSTDLPRYKRSTVVWKCLEGNRFPFPIDLIVYTPSEVEQDKTNKFSFVYEVLKTGEILYECADGWK